VSSPCTAIISAGTALPLITILLCNNFSLYIGVLWRSWLIKGLCSHARASGDNETKLCEMLLSRRYRACDIITSRNMVSHLCWEDKKSTLSQEYVELPQFRPVSQNPLHNMTSTFKHLSSFINLNIILAWIQ